MWGREVRPLRLQGEEKESSKKSETHPVIHPGRGKRDGDNGGPSFRSPAFAVLFFEPPAIRAIGINFFESGRTRVLMVPSHHAKSINGHRFSQKNSGVSPFFRAINVSSHLWSRDIHIPGIFPPSNSRTPPLWDYPHVFRSEIRWKEVTIILDFNLPLEGRLNSSARPKVVARSRRDFPGREHIKTTSERGN